MDTTIIGHWSNGAVEVGKPNGGDFDGRYYIHHLAFPDCPECKGTGIVTTETQEWHRVYIPRKHKRWVNELQTVTHEHECEACKIRFGDKAAIKAAILNVVAQAKSIVSADKRTGTKVSDPAYIETFNVSHPLAHEYRRLLCEWWKYQEPVYTPLEN